MPQAYCALGSKASYAANASGATMAANLDNAWYQAYAGWPASSIKPICPVLWAVGKGDPNTSTFTSSAQLAEFIEALKSLPEPASPGGYQGVSFWASQFHTSEIWDGCSGIVIGPTEVDPGASIVKSITKSGSTVTLGIETATTKNYTLEYKSSLMNPTWIPIETKPGTGEQISLQHAAATGPTGFYRVRID